MLHIYYRLTPADRPAKRPAYFSKKGALLNFLVAMRAVPAARLCVIYDGDERDDEILSVLPHGIEVDHQGGLGNSGSIRHAYDLAIGLPPDDLVYFVEDDYVHVPESLSILDRAARALEADYLTLYDHPVRYADEYRFGLDLPTRHNRILVAADHHWRCQESTCMTFAAHARTLQADREIFLRYTALDVPEDRELFRRLQGLVGYERGSPFRVLLGPMPSLATHCHEPWLAPARDWRSIYEASTVRS